MSEEGKHTMKPSPGNAESSAGDARPPRPSLLARTKAIWAKTGIDLRTFKSMLKGALAPTIALAAYEGNDFADTFTTVGYLVGIMTILSIVISPRAKFIQTMMINILFTCVACAIALLAMFCVVKARINTAGYQGPGEGGPNTSGTGTTHYNSSASAVAGVWLFFQIYCISFIRGRNPKYMVSSILAAIFANVSMAYAPQFTSMAQAKSFAWTLLRAFLTGFGIATGVSLFIFPLNSRQVVFKGMAGYITNLRAVVRANLVYMHSLEDTDMFTAYRLNTQGERSSNSPEAQVFKEKIRALAGLHAKLNTDIPFAKREVALGKLGPDDIQEVIRLLRMIMIPTIGLSCMSDIFNLVAEEKGWNDTKDLAHTIDESPESSEDSSEKIRVGVVNDWHELMKRLRQPFDDITHVIDEGLEHISVTLQLGPSSANKDDEAEAGEPRPGSRGFTTAYERRYREFLKSKETMLRSWCHLHGIEIPQDFFMHPDDASFKMPDWMSEGHLSGTHKRLRRQLFLCLYMEFLLYNIAFRTHQLMLTADKLRDSGKLSKTRLIVPGYKRMRKWFLSLMAEDDIASEDRMDADGRQSAVSLGEGLRKKKDPDHLAPQTFWERFSNKFRAIPHLLESPASAFGFRSACATMCIAIIAYLRDTQTFYIRERIFWAQIMVSISMNPSAGQSLRNFLLRIAGTTLALLLSWVAWYIVDGHTAGVIVFFFILVMFGPYLILKFPQYTTIGMIGQVTMVLILGYELQTRKLGIEKAEANGQAYHPIYVLGPIRLLTVVGGLFVGWVWTIFPYPISEHNQLRKSLGSALYLLANYYSVMHETVRIRLRDEQGDMSSKNSPGRRLEKARATIFSKATLTIGSLRAQCGFLKFDIPVGGKFPREQYSKLVDDVQSALNFMALVSLASLSFSEIRRDGDRENGLEWLANFRRLVGKANVTSQQITTLLSLMSASVTNGQALPPYLRVPEPYLLETELDKLDKDLLSVRHIAEPGYSSFAVIQIGTRCIVDDMKRIVNGVKELVGELDFSYHIISTQTSSENESEETLVYGKKTTDEGDQKKQD